MTDTVYSIFYITSAIILVGGLIAVEIYRHRRGTAGTVKRLISVEPGFGLADGEMEVELDGGEEVTANVPGCVQCMGRFREGDRVLVNKIRGKYMVGMGSGFKRRKTECLKI
ncbi:MAG: hypothetical protein GY771_11075 [bacterium]|nr:hypothetical protein [bacterium]